MLRHLTLLLVLLPGAVSAQTAPFDDDGLPRVVVAPTERKRDRVAIPSVRCTGSGATCDEVDAQLRRNLEISTFFEILDAKTFIANMDQETLTETKWPDWFNVGARYLVKGTVSGAGPFDLELRFFDVLERKALEVKGQSARGLDQKGVHKAVDAFINGVIEAITGMPGIFGSRIVFAVKTGVQTRGIGIMEMDGDSEGGIAGGGTINQFPHFTSGGGILYTSWREGKPDLYIGSKKITHDAYHYRGADMGPGGQIAASLSMGSNSDIYLLSGDGSVLSALTHGEGINVSPTWSPDGSQIAFVSDRAGGPQIYVMGAGGGGASRVTMAGGYNSEPDWGKGGKIVFAAMTGGGSDIFVADPGGGGMERITQDQGTNGSPCWSPDGRYIAFVSSRDAEGRRIYISSADGRWQFPVSKKAGAYSTLRWR